MDWDDIRHFLALARTGSVRAAGTDLGVSHSTVLRRVEALEDRLATRLFDRSRDGYTLTEAGRQMLPEGTDHGLARIGVGMPLAQRLDLGLPCSRFRMRNRVVCPVASPSRRHLHATDVERFVRERR